MTTTHSMVRFLLFALLFGIGVLGVTQKVSAQNTRDKETREKDDNDDDENLSPEEAKQAKVSMDDARTIALKRVSGKIIEEELEKENGRLQYAFDIRDDSGKIWDVEIDAMTGEVLQAVEDDEDGEETDASQVRKKNIFISAAGKVKRTLTAAASKIF